MKNEAQPIITDLCNKYKLSLEAIASKVHVSYASVYYWLHGERKPHYLVIEKLKQIRHGYEAMAKRATKKEVENYQKENKK